MPFVALTAIPSAAGQSTPSRAHVQALDRMMVALASENAEAAATIRTVYREHLDLLFLGAYGDLEDALATGGVALLPAEPLQFNVAPRLIGLHPIGEKDLPNQSSYLAARPAAVGALREIAARVRSGPIEVTSLVRHGAYQDALRATNPNAFTSVPMHTMGLAFDIGVVNTPLKTVYELRDVLRRMRDAGDILFVGERRQLVFHVVPHPSRLGHFTDVHTRLVGVSSSAQGVVVAGRAAVPLTSLDGVVHPTVVAEVVSIVPEDDRLRSAGFSAMDAPDAAHETSATDIATLSSTAGMTLGAPVAARSLLALLAALLAAGYRIRSRS